MTLQASERTIANYSEKLSSLNSLSVLHSIYAFQVVLKEYDFSDPEQKRILTALLERIYTHEESVRASPEGNKFGIKHLALSIKLIECFFEVQNEVGANLGINSADSFETIVSAHKMALVQRISGIASVTQNQGDVIGLLSEYLVTADSQYKNPILYPEKIYLRDEIADRSATFAIAAFVINRNSELSTLEK
jgi:hypothetical protein